MQARRYFGIIDRLAVRGDILPRGRLCHVHGTAADALRCEGVEMASRKGTPTAT